VFPHPPYSQDLAPSGFWLFQKLKETLKGKHFSSSAEDEAAECKWISIKLENFFINRVKNG
jgi:histone-lysine N-methyltransferase SETMAR